MGSYVVSRYLSDAVREYPTSRAPEQALTSLSRPYQDTTYGMYIPVRKQNTLDSSGGSDVLRNPYVVDLQLEVFRR